MSDENKKTSGRGSKTSSKRRRGRRRRSKRKSRSRRGSSKRQSKKLLDTSAVDTDKPADESLTPSEVADMKRHLRFIHRFRSALRVKLNAHEDLLVNGAREPEHRGRCKHLLSKVDRSAVTAALAREPLRSSAEQRVEFLAGAAAITGDAGVLLTYLEELTTGSTSRDVAARAFATTVEHIDFEALSAARMTRLLEIVEATFDGYAKVQAMFGLLQSPRFRRAFDAAVDDLDKGLTKRFVPLRTVWETVERAESGGKKSGRRRGRKRSSDPPREALEAGLRQLLDAPPKVLRDYSERTRERLLDVLVTSASDWPYEHPGVRRLIESFPADSKRFRRHAGNCAEGLVQRGLEGEARKLLKRVTKAHPGHGEAKRLLDYLGKPRVGRYAIDKGRPKQSSGQVEPAFSLDSLELIWLRWGQPGDASRLQRETALHGELALPGITPVLEFQISDRGIPHVAADATLPRLLDRIAGRSPPPLELLVALARSGIAIIRMLAMAGVTLPDLRPERFLADTDGGRPRLELIDLDGAERVAPPEAEAALTPLAANLAQSAFRYPPFQGTNWLHDVTSELRSQVGAWAGQSPDLTDLTDRLRAIAEQL